MILSPFLSPVTQLREIKESLLDLTHVCYYQRQINLIIIVIGFMKPKFCRNKILLSANVITLSLYRKSFVVMKAIRFSRHLC